MKKPAKPIPSKYLVGPMSELRKQLFALRNCPDVEANLFHTQLEERFDDALRLYDMVPTGNREADGNALLTKMFDMRDDRQRKLLESHQREHDRYAKRLQRSENPHIKFPVESWTDSYGDVVKVGDEILFMTLYGQRTAQVLEITEDIDHVETYPNATPAVVFRIPPFQPKGFEHVFKPVDLIQSNSMWNPEKWIGRHRTLLEIHRSIKQIGK